MPGVAKEEDERLIYSFISFTWLPFFSHPFFAGDDHDGKGCPFLDRESQIELGDQILVRSEHSSFINKVVKLSFTSAHRMTSWTSSKSLRLPLIKTRALIIPQGPQSQLLMFVCLFVGFALHWFESSKPQFLHSSPTLLVARRPSLSNATTQNHT